MSHMGFPHGFSHRSVGKSPWIFHRGHHLRGQRARLLRGRQGIPRGARGDGPGADLWHGASSARWELRQGGAP